MNQFIKTYTFDEHFFDIVDTEAKAYFLGFLYADGCVSNLPNYQVKLTLHQRDIDILQKLKHCLNYTGDIKNVKGGTYQKPEYVQILLCSKYFWQQCHKVGLIPKKTFKIRFPQFLDSSLYSHFIRGYFDGDGCIYSHFRCKNKSLSRKNFHLSICSNPQFCQDLQNIFNEKLKIQINVQSHKQCKKVSELKAGGNKKVKIIFDWLYENSTIFLDRKHEKYLELCKVSKEKAECPRILKNSIYVGFDNQKKRWFVRTRFQKKNKRFGTYPTRQLAENKRNELFNFFRKENISNLYVVSPQLYEKPELTLEQSA